MKKRSMILITIIALIMAFSINVNADSASCSGVFSTSFMNDLSQYVYKPVKWITPVLLLVLTSFDFAKVVFSGSKEGMNKAKNNFLKRALAALIVFFAPDIIELLVEFVNDRSIASCMENLK